MRNRFSAAQSLYSLESFAGGTTHPSFPPTSNMKQLTWQTMAQMVTKNRTVMDFDAIAEQNLLRFSSFSPRTGRPTGDVQLNDQIPPVGLFL